MNPVPNGRKHCHYIYKCTHTRVRTRTNKRTHPGQIWVCSPFDKRTKEGIGAEAYGARSTEPYAQVVVVWWQCALKWIHSEHTLSRWCQWCVFVLELRCMCVCVRACVRPFMLSVLCMSECERIDRYGYLIRVGCIAWPFRLALNGWSCEHFFSFVFEFFSPYKLNF